MKKFLISIFIALFAIVGWFGFAYTFNLPVPFTSQAPHADWRQPWQDTCEETSIAMVDFFYARKTFTRDIASGEILKSLRLKESIYGSSLDENATKMTEVINRFYAWEAHVVKKPTLESLKNELNNGRPIIVPMYGKALKNPYFLNGGPVYHVVILSGYDDATQEFITQEPGTRNGENFRYSYNTIMNGNHDYLPNNQTPLGEQVMIFTSPTATELSLYMDGDQDGLSKQEELDYGTIIWLADSDGDGYSDGVEVEFGYSPTIAGDAGKNIKVSENNLIKTATDPRVYLVKDGKRHHIASEDVFLRHGWMWSEIKVMSVGIVNEFELGEPIAI